MGRLPLRLFGLVLITSIFLLSYLTLRTSVFQAFRPVLQPNSAQRSLKTGSIEHTPDEAAHTEALKTEASRPPAGQPKTSVVKHVVKQPPSKTEILRIKPKPPRKLPPNLKTKNTAALFSFTDLAGGSSSAAVQHGLNSALYDLDLEMSNRKAAGKAGEPSKPVRSKAKLFNPGKATKMSIVGNAAVGTKLFPNQTRHTIIATSWRSGSTFLGDLLNHYPGTFYYFEPLHYKLPTQFDRVEFLKKLLSCRFHDEVEGYLRHASMPANRFLVKNHNYRLWEHCSNLLPRDTMCFMPNYLNTVCPVYPVKLIKTVRTRVESLEPLLTDPHLNLKVVVLVRDPRGVYASRRTKTISRWCVDEKCSNPEVGCNNTLSDVQSAQRLEKKYPGSVHIVRYEDLSTSPLDESKALIKFLDLPWTPVMTEFVSTHTSADKPTIVRAKKTNKLEKKVSPYSTSRNSTATAFKWRTTLEWEDIKSLQNICSPLMSEMGYKILKTREELDSSEFPILDINPNLLQP